MTSAPAAWSRRTRRDPLPGIGRTEQARPGARTSSIRARLAPARLAALALLVAGGLVLAFASATPARADPSATPVPAATTPAAAGSTAAPSTTTAATPRPAPEGAATNPATTDGAPAANDDGTDDGSTDDGGEKPSTGIDSAVFGDDQACPPGKPAQLECIPIDHYDIWYDAGSWKDIDTKITGILTQWTFALTRTTVRIGIWVITYSLQFSLAKAFAAPAGQAASTYQNNALLRLGIPLLCLSISQIWSAFQIARGRISFGFAEAATSLFISTLATGLLVAPSQTILGEHGLLNTTRDLGLCVAAATTDGCDTNTGTRPSDIGESVAQQVKIAFVIQPNEILNTGQVLQDDKHTSPCLNAYTYAVQDGPWNRKGDPRRDYLRKAGTTDMKGFDKKRDTISDSTNKLCNEIADWNEKMTAERLVGALLVELAAILVCALMILIGGSLMVAQLVLVTLVCVTFFAVALGQAPGPGRAVFYSWIASCLQAAAAVLIGIIFLSVYLFFLVQLLHATDNQPMIVRFGLMDLLAATSFIFYRRLRRAGENLGSQLGRRMRGFQPGANASPASWMRPAGASGGGGGGGGGGSSPWDMGRGTSASRPLEVAERALYWRRALRRRGGGRRSGGGATAATTRRRWRGRRSGSGGSTSRPPRRGLHIGRNVTIHMSAPQASQAERLRRAEEVARRRRLRTTAGRDQDGSGSQSRFGVRRSSRRTRGRASQAQRTAGQHRTGRRGRTTSSASRRQQPAAAARLRLRQARRNHRNGGGQA